MRNVASLECMILMDNDVASTIYYGLFALQHRGQESCGIAVSETERPKRKSDHT